jgi:hypothetical protein
MTPADVASAATSRWRCAMKLSKRWQDWVALAAGLYALLSPLWTETDTSATWTMVALGGLLALASAWSIVAPYAVMSEYTHIGLGALLVVSPWVMGFADITAMAWTAWATGVVAIAMGLWALPESRAEHGRHVPVH